MRLAIWRAYGERCVYCGERIRFRDLEVDHVVPQGLPAEQLSELLAATGLPADWDVDGLHNLVSACRSCNRRKRDLPFNSRQIILLTSDASARAPIVEVLMERYSREARSDKLRALLEEALTGGAFGLDDLEDVKRSAGPMSAVLHLTSSVNFVDIALSELSSQDVERLRNQRLAAIEIEMQLRDGSRRSVGTVAGYDAARHEGGFAITATDLRCEGWYKNASATFRAVAVAEEAATTFLRAPRLGVCDLDLMPVQLLLSLGPRDEWNDYLSRFETIQDVVRAGEAEIRTVGSSAVTVHPKRGLITSIWELLRADLNGDGFEEILIAIHGRADGGSHGHTADPVLLGRRAADARFDIAPF
jgi:hypothetical protein